jgi:hypothetical protein
VNDTIRFFIVLICLQIIERFGWCLWNPYDCTGGAAKHSVKTPMRLLTY